MRPRPSGLGGSKGSEHFVCPSQEWPTGLYTGNRNIVICCLWQMSKQRYQRDQSTSMPNTSICGVVSSWFSAPSTLKLAGTRAHIKLPASPDESVGNHNCLAFLIWERLVALRSTFGLILRNFKEIWDSLSVHAAFRTDPLASPLLVHTFLFYHKGISRISPLLSFTCDDHGDHGPCGWTRSTACRAPRASPTNSPERKEF